MDLGSKDNHWARSAARRSKEALSGTSARVATLRATGSPTSLVTSDRSLIQACRDLTGKMLNEVVNPWKSQLKATVIRHQELSDQARSAYDATIRAIDFRLAEATKNAQQVMASDLFSLDKVRSRFPGLSDSLFRPAVQQQMLLLRSSGQAMVLPIGSSGQPFPEVDRWVQVASDLQYVSGNVLTTCLFLLRRYGLATSLGIWALGWIAFDFSMGFWLALGSVICLGVIGGYFLVMSARSAVASLVHAIAHKHHYIVDCELSGLNSAAKSDKQAAKVAFERQIASADQSFERSIIGMLRDFERRLYGLSRDLTSIHNAWGWRVASFNDAAPWKSWSVGPDHTGAIRLGEIRFSLAVPPAALATHWAGSTLSRGLAIPYLTSLKTGKSIYLSGADIQAVRIAAEAAQRIVLRILASAPPGRVFLTFVEPNGQGQNAASFLSLVDIEDRLISVWTDEFQIERKLKELTEHMETVLQKYLRTDYQTIEDYNAAAGEVAEAYRVVVIFDFPDGISENAARQLERISQNGPRCGVYALVVHNASKGAAYGITPETIKKFCLSIDGSTSQFHCDNYGFGLATEDSELFLDRELPAGFEKRIVTAFGESAKSALKVEVPYERLLDLAGCNATRCWEASTASGIHIPLGPGSGRKLQFLTLGEGTSNNALVFGLSGSGKSNLMHVIIATAARLYSPEELELYLVDFKEGVEFKRYADGGIPHIRVVAIESEREFGISVLRALDRIHSDRSDTFKNAGVEDIRKYRAGLDLDGKQRKLSRILLMVRRIPRALRQTGQYRGRSCVPARQADTHGAVFWHTHAPRIAKPVCEGVAEANAPDGSRKNCAQQQRLRFSLGPR